MTKLTRVYALLLAFVLLAVCAVPSRAGLVLDPDETEDNTIPADASETWVCAGNNGVKTGGSPMAACADANNAGPRSDPPYFVQTIQYCDNPIYSGDRSQATAVCHGTSQYIGPYGPGATTSITPTATAQITVLCSAGSIGSGTTCTCKDGFSPDAQKLKCTPKCVKGKVKSAGYFDIGPTAGATPQLLGCSGECGVTFDGVSPAGSALVNGVKHWYAKGTYTNTGKKCTPAQVTSLNVGQATDSKPADGCAPGQGMISMNGRTQCVDQNGDGKSTTPQSTPKQETKTDKTTATNPDGSTTTTEKSTSVDANGNKETTITRTTTKPDGSTSVEVEKVGALPGNGSQSSDTPTEDPQKGECEKNPSAAGCGGDTAVYGDLYTKKDKTLSGVLSAAKDSFMSSPVGAAVGGFFVVPSGGACPVWSANVPFLKSTLTIDQFCSPMASAALALLKAALLVVASFFAFRIAIE